MKKILFVAAIAATAVMSCTKSEVVDINQDVATNGISFNAFTSGTTKAEDITTSNVTGEKFLIQAYQTAGAYASNTPTSWFYSTNDDALVYKKSNDDASADSWHTRNQYGAGDPTIYFWPTADDDKLSFFATNAEKTDETMIAGLTAPTGSGVYPSFDYTVNTVDKMQDLLVASTMDGTAGVVSLSFNHALAKLNFKAQGSDNGGYGVKADGTEGDLDYVYTVRSITISDLYEAGKFTFDEDAFTPINGSWTPTTTTTQSYTYDLTNVLATNLSGTNDTPFDLAYSDVTSNNSLLLLPQTGNTIKIAVQYMVQYDGLIIYPLKDDKTAYADLAAIEAAESGNSPLGVEEMEITLSNSTFELNPNSQTVLTLVLPSPGDLLTYKVEVSEWDTEKSYKADSTTGTTVVTSQGE